MRNTLYEYYLEAIDRKSNSRYSRCRCSGSSLKGQTYALAGAGFATRNNARTKALAAIRNIIKSVHRQIQALALVSEAPNILQPVPKTPVPKNSKLKHPPSYR